MSRKLTARELDVLRGLLQCWTDPEIARHLGMSLNTVKRHNQAIYIALGICGRKELIPLMVAAGTVACIGHQAKAVSA